MSELNPTRDRDIHPEHPPVVPLPQEPFLPRRRLQRLVNLFPPGQFVRYLCVGVFNTVFGYLTFAIILTLLNGVLPQRYVYLTVVVASIIAQPLNITVAYFGYKIFVFRTQGNYLAEWLKAFAVYGTSMIPGLIALSALTRLLQSVFHRHGPALHEQLASLERHLGGHLLAIVQHLATGKAMAGYVAGAIIIGVSTIFSFVGHKNVTFKPKSISPSPQP